MRASVIFGVIKSAYLSKDFTLIQSPYVNYKIDVEYQNYILKYNEESFNTFKGQQYV